MDILYACGCGYRFFLCVYMGGIFGTCECVFVRSFVSIFVHVCVCKYFVCVYVCGFIVYFFMTQSEKEI